MKISLCDRCRAECKTVFAAGQKIDASVDLCDSCRTSFAQWWNLLSAKTKEKN